MKGTGGGPAETAELNDTETLCLNLLGRIATEGDPELREIGLTDEGASTSSDYEKITLVVEDEDAPSAECLEEEADTGLIDMKVANSETFSTQRGEETPVRPNISTSRKKRVTRTPIPKPSTLKELSNSNERICEALAALSSSINDLSESNNSIATSINNLADAIKLWAEQRTKL